MPDPTAVPPDAITIGGGALALPGPSAPPAAASPIDPEQAARAASYRAGSWSPNTLRSYQRAWKGWEAWAAAQNVQAKPAEPRDVEAYIRERAARGRALATLRADADGIGAAHRTAGLPDPCPQHGSVRALISAIAKQRKTPQRQAAALDETALAAIRATAGLPRHGPGGRGGTPESDARATARARLDLAIVGLLSDGGLRRSEASALRWRDVERTEQGRGRITIRHSKTDQEGAGAVVLVSRATMAALDALRNGAPDEALVIGLSPTQIARRVKAAARAAGLGEGFSGHSGRVGMARRMVKRGAPLPTVQRQGRWKSQQMVAAYTRAEAVEEAAPYIDAE